MRIVDPGLSTKNIRLELILRNSLGEKPHVMGQVVRMYPRLTISNLTEGLRNVYTNKSLKERLPINSYAIQWRIDVNFIKRLQLMLRLQVYLL
jgi:hypothetical protein